MSDRPFPLLSLPDRWSWAELEHLAAAEPNAMTDGPFGSKLKSEHYTDEGVRVVRLGNLGIGRFLNKDRAFISREHYENLRKHEVFAGDLIVAALAEPVGRCCRVPPNLGTAIVKADCVRFKPHQDVEPEFLMNWLNSPSGRKQAEDACHGIGRLRMNMGDMRALLVPVAPHNEQRRVVAKIDALTARSRTAREALEKVPALLEQFRQSVLAAAFRGDLTAEWRRKHPDVEPASVLLERIRAERRRRWEESELAAMQAKGKKPTNDEWKSRYHGPQSADVSKLATLPAGWCWATVDEVLFGIETGANFKCLERPPLDGEVGVVKVSAVTWGEYDEQATKTCTDKSRIDERLFVRPGDFLFSRANTLELVGACVIAGHTERQVMLSDKILRFLIVADLDPRWLLQALRSPLGRGQIERLASGNQLSMRNIGQERIRSICIPLPPAAELPEVLRRLSGALDAVRAMGEQAQAAMRGLGSLDQAVLAKAFRGELVPQDPNDEPASALLERIRAEREAAQSTTHVTRPRRAAAKVTGTRRPAPAPPPPPRPPAPVKKPHPDTKRLQAVLVTLKRDALHRVADAEGVELADRRSLDAARDGLLQAGVALEVVLGHLDRDELKAVCRALGLEDRGRTKDELRARILRGPEVAGA